jgi:LysR family transcriptional regulator, transcriptional activator of the cysJI operon
MDQQLQAFIAVAELQNFTRAAELLHTTQPAISVQIQNLERIFGTKLLDRTNKYVRLNRAGDIVYYHAKQIQALHEQMERYVDDLVNTAGGKLAIGSSYTFGEYVLPRLIAQFCHLYPLIRPKISIENTREVVGDIARGTLDIGIVEGQVDAVGVIVESYSEDIVHIVASSECHLATDVLASPEALSQVTWIVREEGSGTREVTDRVLREWGIHPQALIEFGSTQAVKEAVEAGMGITVLSNWVTRKELQLGTLVTLKCSETPIRRNFYIVTRQSEFHTKAAQTFREFLLKEWT